MVLKRLIARFARFVLVLIGLVATFAATAAPDVSATPVNTDLAIVRLTGDDHSFAGGHE